MIIKNKKDDVVIILFFVDSGWFDRGVVAKWDIFYVSKHHYCPILKNNDFFFIIILRFLMRFCNYFETTWIISLYLFFSISTSAFFITHLEMACCSPDSSQKWNFIGLPEESVQHLSATIFSMQIFRQLKFRQISRCAGKTWRYLARVLFTYLWHSESLGKQNNSRKLVLSFICWHNSSPPYFVVLNPSSPPSFEY